jgi:AAA family ATP:ADP antiporter
MPHILKRAVDARRGEWTALIWAWLYIFAVMCSYSILRPIRDDMGVAGGIEKLPWLFTATLVGMMLVNPAFAALVARLSRASFITISYQFFALNLLIFAWLLHSANETQNIWIGRVFFVWVSIFNLFVVSVFWGLMADVFDTQQGTRLFGVIASGMSLGGIAGAGLTAWLATRISHSWLLVCSAMMLEAAIVLVLLLIRSVRSARTDEMTADRIGGSSLAGMRRALSSPYLINISIYMLLYTITSTLLYFQQAEIARAAFPDRGARTAFFARIDLWVNGLTLFSQLFLTARIMRALGVALTLTILPALTIIGFGALSIWPAVGVIVAFQVLRRAGNFSLARPAREVLYTVVPREDKYKTKSFIDTVVYRTGDQIGAWSNSLLGSFGLGMTAVALLAVPISLAWLVNGYWLGKKQAALAPRADVNPPDETLERRLARAAP